METSLRYGRDSKALRIHAKEKFPLNSLTHLQKKSKGVAEFVWSTCFRKDQDVRLKIGYDVTDKIRENNRTLNADMDGRWNVRFDL